MVWSGRDLVIITGTFALAIAIQAALQPAAERANLEHGVRGEVFSSLFSILPTIATACTVVLRARLRGGTAADLGLVRPRHWRPAVFAWLIAVSAGPLTAWSAGTFGAIGRTTLDGRLEASHLNVATLGIGGLLLVAIELAVVVPVIEELIFRGVIHRSLRTRWSLFPAAIASALVFALAHLAPAEVVPLFIVGFVLAWSCERSDSLWGAIVPHGGLNALVLLATMAHGR